MGLHHLLMLFSVFDFPRRSIAQGFRVEAPQPPAFLAGRVIALQSNIQEGHREKMQACKLQNRGHQRNPTPT